MDYSWPLQDDPEYQVGLKHRARIKAWMRLDKFKRRFGGYASYALTKSERVGTYDVTLREMESILRDKEFSYEPIAAAKRDWDGRFEAGSWVRRDSKKKQLHVHLFITKGGRIIVAAHLELNWKRHPIRHYKPDGLKIGPLQFDEGMYDPSAGVAIVKPLIDDAVSDSHQS